MYSHKILFRIPNPIPRAFFDSLLKVHVFSDEHVGIGGMEPHYVVEVAFGRGAGYRFGRTLYLAHDCFARKAWGEEHNDRFHYQYGASGQGVRIPWQFGITNNANMIPYSDSGSSAEASRNIIPAMDRLTRSLRDAIGKEPTYLGSFSRYMDDDGDQPL